MIMFEIEGSPNITGWLATNDCDGACLMAEVRALVWWHLAACWLAGSVGDWRLVGHESCMSCCASTGTVASHARQPNVTPLLALQRGLGTLTVKHTGVSGSLPPCIFSPHMAQVSGCEFPLRRLAGKLDYSAQAGRQ